MKVILHRYKIPFLFALVIGLYLIIFGGVTEWHEAVFTFLGAFVGMMLPDLEYIVFAFIIDPGDQIYQHVKELLRQRNYRGYVALLDQDEYKFGETSVHSAIFVMLLWVFAFYTTAGSVSYFAKALALSMLVTLLYKAMVELYKTKSLNRWFWMFDFNFTYKRYLFALLSMVALTLFIFTFV